MYSPLLISNHTYLRSYWHWNACKCVSSITIPPSLNVMSYYPDYVIYNELINSFFLLKLKSQLEYVT